MATLIDYILDLFRSEEQAQAFVNNPDQALRAAGLPNVSPAQVQAVAATAAPSLALGNGDPVVGLQRAVADHHGFQSNFLSPQTSTEFASRNNTEFASHNDTSLLSPDQHAGANAQAGAFNLGFGDVTLGDKTTTTATGDGAVAIGGDNQGDIASGDGAVLGNNNNVNNGDIHTGAGSNVALGEGNVIKDSGTTAGGDAIVGNKGPVLDHVDTGGGSGGAAHGGGGLINAGDTTGGGGGGGGGINIDSHDSSAVFGDQTNVETHGDTSGGINASHHDDESTGHNVDSHNVDSHAVDSHNVDSHNATVDTTVDTGIDVGL
jgi:hypothetical protein